MLKSYFEYYQSHRIVSLKRINIFYVSGYVFSYRITSDICWDLVPHVRRPDTHFTRRKIFFFLNQNRRFVSDRNL